MGLDALSFVLVRCMVYGTNRNGSDAAECNEVTSQFMFALRHRNRGSDKFLDVSSKVWTNLGMG